MPRRSSGPPRAEAATHGKSPSREEPDAEPEVRLEVIDAAELAETLTFISQ